MEAQLICSNSFLSRLPQSSKLISINVKRPMIKAKLPFSTFNPILIKLVHKHTPKTSDQIVINNSSSSKQSAHISYVKKKNHFSFLVDNILNTFDDLISTFLDLPLHSGIDPKQVLTDNFEPVNEYPPTPCPVVEGSLPSCLDGAYIRNGANPRFVPNGPYHFVDGDGMLHMVKISKGKATFCCRYVKTHKYQVESEIGYPVIPSFIASFNGPAASVARVFLVAVRILIARQFDPVRHGFGVANTSVALIAGRLFATCESDLPYEIKVTKDGDVITLGRHGFNSTEASFSMMTAHPKTDMETGDTFAYRYGTTSPFLTFHRIDNKGRKQKDVPIFSKKDCTAVHDFGITENYAVFPDLQLVINPMWVLRGRDTIVGVDSSKIPRIGIIPKYAMDEGEIRWIDTPGLNMFHSINAWEENGGNTIVMVATNSLKVECVMEKYECSDLTLEKVTIDVKTKSVKRRPLAATGRFHELGTINPAYASKKNRYVYAAVIVGRAFVGMEKFDLSITDGDCTVARRMYGPGSYGGESLFVAREPDNPTADEDDGYLITYVHDKNTEESKFLVMDAKSPNLDIIAAVKLPQRIPNGFHGLFVAESDLNIL
ncbi:carotenoid cleavage dioxygenase 4 [Castilleja foliolosa]|uniref:Carotenoid cleavage dioxygenase 4 n=1 Tax=Castilleja foliolosa TaxID=1961234 RepID=A0ABD3DU58_9LAMI